MSAVLTDNLPLLAGAPNGIKKLRELILELAVRGKLVPQNANDEPASDLLKRIAGEKARLVAEGKIKKQKPLAEISEEVKPFDVPTNWEWVRVAAVGHDWGQKTPDKKFAYIDVGAVDNAAGKISAPQVLMAEDAPSRARKVVRSGTVIYSTIRPYLLNVAVIEEVYEQETIASTAFAIIHPYLEMPARYFLYFLRSPVFVRYVESVQMGIAYPAINDGQFFSGLIPLPPLPEQHRIVAKVDELMALCDRLEARQADADSAHVQLVQALLSSLSQASDADDFAQSWQRLSEHFHTLFTTESSIDALKQTLLQLAVMGKLVPQDPNDEPAGLLMTRLRQDRSEWLIDKQLDDPECKTMLRKLSSLTEALPPFPLPESWVTVHLIDCSRLLVDCHNKTAPYVSAGVPIIRTSNIRNREFRLDDLKYVNEETYEFWSRRCTPEPRDIMFTREAPMGEAAIIPDGERFCLGQRTMLVRPMHDFIDNRYLLIALTEPHLLERASTSAIGSTVKHLRVGDVELLNIPLPPLAEQHRIVAKVDQLMALCDQLKARLNQARQVHEQLASALVEQAVA